MPRKKRVLQQLTIDGRPEIVATLDLCPSWGGARPGAGRPRSADPTKVISIRVPESLYHRIKTCAEGYGLGMTSYIVAVLSEYPRRIDPVP